MSDDDGDLTHESAEFFEATYLLLVASLSIGCAHVMEKYHFHFIPESGAIILIGSLFGFIGWVTDSVQIEAASSFNTDIFQLIFLPAIIFESGYSLRKKGLFKNWKPILLYAVFGVAISTAIVALAVIFIFTPNGIGDLTQIEALMFGALISATDPVATLAIFSNLFALDENEDDEDAPTLYNLVFGESVLNDAVAIVLFNTFEGFKNDVAVDGPLFGKIIGNFIYVSICSILIGVGFGLLSALITKWSAIRNNSKFDLVVLYLCAYGSYMIASAFELSGLFAIFFCGIVMGHYTWYNLSAFSKLTSPILFKAIANLCEMLVFCFLGMALFGSSEVRDAWSFKFSVSVFAAMTIGRIVQVVPLTALANWGRRDKITPKEQVAIMYAGLRGALAFALALKTESLKLEHSSQIISCTLTIAMFTTLFQGATTRPLLKSLGLSGATAPQMVPLLNAESVQSSSMSSITSTASEKSSTRRWIHNLDVSLFAPLFLLNTQVSGGKTKKQFREFANGLTQLNYQQKLDAHKEELYNLVLKFSAVDQQESKSKIQAERQKTNDTGARFSL